MYHKIKVYRGMATAQSKTQLLLGGEEVTKNGKEFVQSICPPLPIFKHGFQIFLVLIRFLVVRKNNSNVL